MNKAMSWFDRVSKYIDFHGENNLQHHSVKIHVSIGGPEGIICFHRKNYIGKKLSIVNYVTPKTFEKMKGDGKIYPDMLCKLCWKKATKQTDWNNPTSDIQMLTLANTKL